MQTPAPHPSRDHTVLQKASFGPFKRDVTMSEMFNLLQEHRSTRKIRRHRPDIRPMTVMQAHAILIAHHRDVYDEMFGCTTSRDFKILLDENIPARALPGLRDVFRSMAQNHLLNLHAMKDHDLWIWAMRNGIDAIITRDKARQPLGETATDAESDLTELAVETARFLLENGSEGEHKTLPLIIHIDSNGDVMKKVIDLARRHRDAIYDHLETRTTPYIRIGDETVHGGPSFEALLNPEIDRRGIHEYLTDKLANRAITRMGPDQMTYDRLLQIYREAGDFASAKLATWTASRIAAWHIDAWTEQSPAPSAA